MFFIVASIGYIIGIIWGLCFEKSVAFFFIILLLFGVLMKDKVIYPLKDKIGLKIIFICIFTLMVLLGNYNVVKREKQRENLVKQVIQEEKVEYVGTVVGKLEETQYQYNCIVKIEKIGNQKLGGSKKIKLVIKKGDKFSMQYGDKIQFQGRWEEFDEQRNEGGWNSKEAFLAKGIYGRVLLVGKGKVVKQKNIGIVSWLAFETKEKLESNFKEIFPEEVGNFLKGILIGEKREMEEEVVQNFKVSNLSHLLAVSGMHVGYLVLGVKLGTRKYKRVGGYLTIAILIFFMFLVGFTPSVVRACLMGIIGIIGTMVYRKANPWISICISLLVLLIQNPFAIREIGLLLSYGGTIGILLFQKKIGEKLEKIPIFHARKFLSSIMDVLSVTFSAQIVIMPIMLLKFGTISFTFFLSNLLVAPFLGIVVVGGFLIFFLSCISITIAKFPAILMTMIIRLLLWIVGCCAKIPMSQVYCVLPKWWQVLGYYLGIWCVAYKMNSLLQEWKKHKKKVIPIVLSICLLVAITNKIPKEFQLFFIDVGQGDSSLIITPTGKRILIDGGGSRSTEKWDVGENTLVPFLLYKGIYRIDYLMISHFDADHVRTDC